MDNIKTHILLFFLPLVLANTFHIVFVKKNWLSFLNTPISTKLFGANKTIRGFIVLPFFSGSLTFGFSYLFGPFVISSLTDLYIGIGLGICYLLSELPNSYIKRRLGISNGEHSEKYKVLQMFIDKTDSLIGTLIFYYFVYSINGIEVVKLFFMGLAISISVSYLLYSLKIKKSF